MRNKIIVVVIVGIIFGSFWSIVIFNKLNNVFGIVLGVLIGVVMFLCGYKLANKNDKK